MSDLPNEYTDTKGIRHEVKHLIVPAEDKNSKDRIIEELFRLLESSEKSFFS